MHRLKMSPTDWLKYSSVKVCAKNNLACVLFCVTCNLVILPHMSTCLMYHPVSLLWTITWIRGHARLKSASNSKATQDFSPVRLSKASFLLLLDVNVGSIKGACFNLPDVWMSVLVLFELYLLQEMIVCCLVFGRAVLLCRIWLEPYNFQQYFSAAFFFNIYKLKMANSQRCVLKGLGKINKQDFMCFDKIY